MEIGQKAFRPTEQTLLKTDSLCSYPVTIQFLIIIQWMDYREQMKLLITSKTDFKDGNWVKQQQRKWQSLIDFI